MAETKTHRKQAEIQIEIAVTQEKLQDLLAAEAATLQQLTELKNELLDAEVVNG